MGQAFGGDLEAVTLHTGLLAARHVLGADVAVVAQGPGNLGTGTRWGFSGVAAGEAVNAVARPGRPPGGVAAGLGRRPARAAPRRLPPQPDRLRPDGGDGHRDGRGRATALIAAPGLAAYQVARPLGDDCDLRAEHVAGGERPTVPDPGRLEVPTESLPHRDDTGQCARGPRRRSVETVQKIQAGQAPPSVMT